MWADHVIVADQGSTDGTLELLQSTRDVETIMNAAKTYDERHRQRLLVDKAREIPGKRILIALDADEILSANCSHSDEWTQIISAKPGTILRFRWVNILTGFKMHESATSQYRLDSSTTGPRKQNWIAFIIRGCRSLRTPQCSI